MRKLITTEVKVMFRNSRFVKMSSLGALTLICSWLLATGLTKAQDLLTRDFMVPALGVTSGVSTGDFNKDGFLDIIALHSRSVSILLGDGKGEFTGAKTFGLNSMGGSGKVIGDFNNDNTLDVAAADKESGVHVLLGDGKGGFYTVKETSIETSWIIVAGDFNGDGNLDLVTYKCSSDDIRNATSDIILLAGDGQGGFTVSTRIPMGRCGEWSKMAVGDFNNDGNSDLVITSPALNRLAILLGNGQGRFTRTDDIEVIVPVDVAVGDINNDRNLDLVVTSNPTRTDGDTKDIHILQGNGHGGFTLVRTLHSPIPCSYPPCYNSSILYITLADLNKDGNVDLIYGQANKIHILYGDGIGNFGSPKILHGFGGWNAPALGDFDGDGNLDLAIGDMGAVSVVFLRNSTLPNERCKGPVPLLRCKEEASKSK
jgi:hypothetical protein